MKTFPVNVPSLLLLAWLDSHPEHRDAVISPESTEESWRPRQNGATGIEAIVEQELRQVDQNHRYAPVFLINADVIPSRFRAEMTAFREQKQNTPQSARNYAGADTHHVFLLAQIAPKSPVLSRPDSSPHLTNRFGERAWQADL